MTKYNTALVEKMVANGETASREKNDKLYPAVASGDPAAIKQMIESNMALVIDKVDSYIKCYQNIEHLRDDLISEGFLGLTTAVNRMAEQGPRETDINPTGYISYWVYKSIGIVVDGEHANGCTVRTVQRARQKGEEIPHQVAVPVMPDILVDPTAMLELRDVIDACCETEQDRIIVKMREEGYKDKEIAAAIDTPFTTTYMLRRAIYTRFLERTGMKGEA